MKITDEMLHQYAPQARDIWLDTLPKKDDIPAFSCSNSFLRKMNRLLRRQRRAPKVNQRFYNMKRVAAAVLIVVVVTFAGLMTVQAVREKVIDVVVHIYHELTRFDYSSEKDATVPPELYFGYLPEGMELVYDEIHGTSRRSILWESALGQYLDLGCVTISQNSADTQIIDMEDAQVTTCTIQDKEATIVSKEGTIIVLWIDENIHYTIQSNLELSELVTFIERLSVIP